MVFLTVDDENGLDQVFFINEKDNYDIYPSNTPYWYEEGKTVFCKDKYLIKSWSVIGKKKNIEEIKENLLNSSLKSIICNSNKLKVQNDTSIDALCDSKRVVTFTINNWQEKVGATVSPIIDKRICNLISGYKNNPMDHISSMFPPCFLNEDELYNCLLNETFLQSKNIGPQVSFSGTGLNHDKIIEGYEGVVQNIDQNLSPVSISIFDDNNTTIASTTINLNNGISSWFAKSNTSASSGSYILKDNSGSIIGRDNFQLIMNFNIDVKPVSANFVDLYKRKISNDFSNKDVTKISNISWKPSYQTNPEFLSDELSDLFLFLGKEIIIQDPYLFGFTEKNDKLELNESSKCFINSIFIYLYKLKTAKITFLIDPKKLNLANSQLEDKYKQYISNFFKVLEGIASIEVDILFSKTPIHDRFFLSQENSTIFSSTKSVNGILMDDHDLSISKLSSIEYKKNTAKILRRIMKARKNNE
jgi:hypothetical protein